MKLGDSDTIAAIATPLGEGAISVIRLSGPEAITIADLTFQGKYRLVDTPGHTIRHGKIVDSTGVMVDEVLASIFRSPKSYTGEDLVEISGHGGVFVTKKILSVLLEAGSRQADPGEFTKRAFLNGKIDLSQAEAIGDLIKAGSERAVRNSALRLAGVLGELISTLRAELTEARSLLELQLDFSEEEIVVAPSSDVLARIKSCNDKIQAALSTFGRGRVIRDGAVVSIIGRPNVGKSSLFNRLLLENRSIVTPIAGTTRDFLEETLLLDGVQVRLVDTAGLREDSTDDVELTGISRTKEIMERSEVVILVSDSTQEGSAEISKENMSVLAPRAKIIGVKNKADLILEGRRMVGDGEISVSALTGFGVDCLRERISQILLGDLTISDSEPFICSNRQAAALKTSMEHLKDAQSSMINGYPPEFVAYELNEASISLSEITGEITTDDVLNSVFSRFCIGK